MPKPWKLLLDTRGHQGATKNRPCLARKNLPAWAIPMARRLPERDCPDFSWRPPGFDDMKQGLRLSFPGTRYAVHNSRGLGWRSFLQEPVSESGIAMDRCGGAASGQLKNVAKVTLATRGSGNGYGLIERRNSARSLTMRRHHPIPEGSGQPPAGEAPVSESGIAMDHYGGAASGQGVAMGKRLCYNPEGQRARGPEGQRARLVSS